MTEPEEPSVYLIAGGSPAALALRDRLNDPEQRAALEAAVRRFAEQLGTAITPAIEEFRRQAVVLARWAEDVTEHLREAGVLPEQPPEDPRARALWLRQHRGTGPDRQVQHRPRPRRIP